MPTPNGFMAIYGHGNSVTLNSTNSSAVPIPRTNGGFRPRRIRIAIDSGVAWVRMAQTASTNTATTGDSIITPYAPLYLQAGGMDAVQGLQQGSAQTKTVLQVSPIEDGFTT